MGDSCNCCSCWRKTKPTETPPAYASVNPRTSAQGRENTSMNPSTDSSNRLQIVISSAHPASTTPPQPSNSKKPPPTLDEVKSSFEKIDIESQADGFIKTIEDVLKAAQKHTQDTPSTSSSNTDKLSNWDYFIQSGGKFLKFVNDHTEKMKIDSKDSFFQSGEATKIVGKILEQIGHMHWAVAGLSIVGYLVSKCAQVSKNRTECLELLQEMITLVSHIKDLNKHIIEEKEKFEKAFQYIIEGSISCASQLHSAKLFRFLKSTVNSDTLTAIRTKISGLYRDLNLTATRKVLSQETKILDKLSKRTPSIKEILDQMPVTKEILPQSYPSDAVGIEEQVKAVNELLNMENIEDCSSIAVVIWGLGGIGKTTLAKAVISRVDRNRYNYARIELDLVSKKNNYREMQEQILKDGFPSYEGGRKIKLRDDADGRDHLIKAFKSGANKPLFLFIDNALHTKDLEKILPEDLQGLPQRSRILATTRILNETDVLQERGLQRKDYPVKTLSDDYALTVLCNDPATRDGIKDDLKRIVKLCNGIPLVLKIVGAHLRKQKYKADRCTQILEALQTGGKIKEKDLSNRLFDFVYGKLEKSTQEAFLDICCFFHKDYLRRQVEYIVGAEEVASLVDAALITTVMRKDDEEELSVHDIIRSIGRTMSKSSRIMDENSWFKVEKDEAKLKGIKGVRVENSSLSLKLRHLHSMKDTLRILLWLGSIDVNATDAVTLPELRCILTQCDICGLNVETLDKLAVLVCEKLPTKQRDHLKLPESLRWITAHRQPVENQNLSKTVPNSSLEELIIVFSNEKTDFSVEEKYNSKSAFNRFLQGVNKLKHLHVDDCWSLCELPEQVCKLQQLSTLMIHCYELECLPELFGQLTTLRKLNLSGCESLKELSFISGEFTNLRELYLRMCRSLKELPFTIGQLTSLKKLDLWGCRCLKKLPSTFGQLTTLRELILSDCESLKELPSTFNNLKSLEYVNVTRCFKLESDICQMDDSIKIIKKSEHNCTNCQKDKKLKIIKDLQHLNG